MPQNLTATNDFDFTFREIQILQLCKDNFSCKEIAIQLFIAETTVRKHRRNILTKIGLSGKKEFRKFLRIYLPPPISEIIIRFIDLMQIYTAKLLLFVVLRMK
jgi:DNA-binding CsgD family transcriptional regulator